MKIQSIKVDQARIIASVEEGGMVWDVQLPTNLSTFKDYLDRIKTEVIKKKQNQVIVELQALVGVDLMDDVAVFAATKDAPSNVGKLLAKPADPVQGVQIQA